VTELPTGTVTFLFTDIEGSTRLLQEYGDAYGDLLAEHRTVLRAAFARHSGVEVGAEGDSFFVVLSGDGRRAGRRRGALPAEAGRLPAHMHEHDAGRGPGVTALALAPVRRVAFDRLEAGGRRRP
jgi:class 3 adenylate cyclase